MTHHITTVCNLEIFGHLLKISLTLYFRISLLVTFRTCLVFGKKSPIETGSENSHYAQYIPRHFKGIKKHVLVTFFPINHYQIGISHSKKCPEKVKGQILGLRSSKGQKLLIVRNSYLNTNQKEKGC